MWEAGQWNEKEKTLQGLELKKKKFLECSVMRETVQKTRDVSTMVKDVSLVRLHWKTMEKLRVGMEKKRVLCERS